jgi:hypothetical protein
MHFGASLFRSLNTAIGPAQLAPTNLPRWGFFLEITELPNVEVFGAVLGSSRAGRPPGREARLTSPGLPGFFVSE